MQSARSIARARARSAFPLKGCWPLSNWWRHCGCALSGHAGEGSGRVGGSRSRTTRRRAAPCWPSGAERGATSPIKMSEHKHAAHQGRFGSRPPKRLFSAAVPAVRVARISVRGQAEPRRANLDVRCRSPCSDVPTGDRQLGLAPGKDGRSPRPSQSGWRSSATPADCSEADE